MKRSISDLLDHYREDRVDLMGDTPLSPVRIKELTMKHICEETGGNRRPASRQRKRFFSRGLLVAALLLSLCCLTAFAVVFTLRDAARADMGVSQDDPIREWTEYDAPLQAGTETEPQATLVATMCGGSRLYAYIAVSPVPEEAAAGTSPEWEWAPRGGLDGCTALHLEQAGYDPDTRTSLVKVSMTLEDPSLEQVEVSMNLCHDLKPIAAYGPVTVPVTESQALTCPADITVVNTTRQLKEAWGLRPDMPAFSQYTQEGTIDRISICAGYIELEMTTPTLEEWTAVSGAEVLLELEEQSDTPLPPQLEGYLVRRMFGGSWSVSVEETLADARLNYRDGTSELIRQIPSPYAGTWLSAEEPYPDASEDGIRRYRFTPLQAFDLSQVESITMAGKTYPFPQPDDLSA